jgi:hypothetical protein
MPELNPVTTAKMPRVPRRLLRFEDVEVRQDASECVYCRVTLGGQSDRQFVGEGSSVVLGSASMTAAARATVHALQTYTDERFTLESINKTSVAGRDLIVAVVGIANRPAQELTGAVVIHGDEARAAALAVLDATNRWLETHNRQGLSPC